MREQSTGHDWQSSQSWVTHSYPVGEHPAEPAPIPAPFWADSADVLGDYETDAADDRVGGESW